MIAMQVKTFLMIKKPTTIKNRVLSLIKMVLGVNISKLPFLPYKHSKLPLLSYKRFTIIAGKTE